MNGRQHLYHSVAEALRERLAEGAFQDGALPAELDLAADFGVSRLTVRKALGQLRDEGLVEARRGSGWYAARGRVHHTLNHLGTIEGQLADKGILAERRILDFSFVPATGKVKDVLGTDSVLRVTRLNLGDGEPVARVTAWCPERFGRDMSKSAVEQHSIYDLLPVQLREAIQVISAVEAGEEDARLLGIPVGSACLMSERTTFDVDGEPVLYAIALFPGRSIAYLAHLSRQEPGTGLRLAAMGDEESSALDESD
ncbi:MAG: GntR family transcriptional regulator [Acidimicrobiales bacterium]